MNSVETALLDNINNPNALFIFPTDISASQWADHVLRLMGPGTIAMNKFIAWDVFKQKSIKSKVQNKKSIPSALRKIFVSRLVKENADAARNNTPVFCSLILPEWAQQASQFTSWLTVILPQLGAWFNKTTGLSIDSILSAESEKAASEFKGDDLDLFVLARRYARFLETYSLFEPAWETPPFNNDGKNCFIFFPESLSDYNDYRDLLSESNHVKTISAPDAKESDFDTFFYTNSRSEITEAALYIRALNEKHGILWDSIVVCIPDSKHYEPYVIREFVNRNIPFVKRTSKPLTDYPAGRFFRSILDCTNGDFSFSSLVSLIMNKNLPWKNTIQIEKLIQFGIKNNCLYSWTEDKDGKEQHINVWEDSFNSPVEFFDNDVRKFFMDLKKRALSLRCADSFAELRRQYFIFREHFFNMDECSEEANQVLSRCISELMNLTELEKSFPDVPAVDPFLFLTEYLSEVSYLPQAKSSGVAILPYKTAAAAPFDYHIVLGAGHENISVIFSRLNFLPGKKRDELGIYDEDASAAFINMHVFNSVKKSAFFCSEHTFSDYAIPHPKTNSPGEPVQRYADNHEFKDTFSADYYNTESSFSFSESISLHENQKKGFTEWKNRRGQTAALDNSENTSSFTAGDKINDIIKTRYTEKKKPRISASSLQTYFQCSLKWLFQRVFSLENLQIETSLMAENISGTVYHAVLNEFFDKLKIGNDPLLKPVNTGFGPALPAPYQKILKAGIDKVFDSFPVIKSDRETRISVLTTRLLEAEKSNYMLHLENTLAYFLSFFAGCHVIGSESYYTFEDKTYLLNGYIDCILKDTSGETEKYIIVDFKRKGLPKRADCAAEEENPLRDFQLPMYITLVEENENIKVYTALFYSILNSKPEVLIGAINDINTEKTIPAKEKDQIKRGSEWHKKIFDEFKDKTEQFAKEISTGNYTVFPQDSNDCYGCDYHRICRTVYIIDRENNYPLGKD